MRALAITGMETASMIPSIMSGSLIRETPPWARMSAGTRSSAITATAPASSAIFACSAVTTSMITPPLSISAMPRLTRAVPVTGISDTTGSYPRAGQGADGQSGTGGLLGGFQARVVDVEVARCRVAAGQPEQPDQRAAAYRQRIPYRVGVH